MASSQSYDPDTRVWTVAATLDQGRAYGTAVLLRDGTVLALGGETVAPGVGSGTSTSTSAAGTASAELYDPATDSWTPTVSMAQNRVLQTTTLLSDGRVLVAGGASHGKALAIVEVYVPGTRP